MPDADPKAIAGPAARADGRRRHQRKDDPMTQDNQDPEDDEAVEETAPVAPQGPQKYRVDRDGYVDVGGGKDRVYVGKSLAGALVTISDSP